VSIGDPFCSMHGYTPCNCRSWQQQVDVKEISGMENYTAIRCARCGKEIKRLTAGMIVHCGNPNYCRECNEKVQTLPN